MDTIQDENAILKEGFLVKRGHIVHNWKTRWFVLFPDRLLYYRYEGGKRESCPRGKVFLADCKVTCPCLEYENRPMVIKLKTQKSTEYFLEACSREQRDTWASSITAAIHTLRPAQAPKPDPEHSPIELHNVSLSQVADSMHDIHSGIKLMNHIEQGSSFKKCFTGSALVDWLVSLNFVVTRFEAVTLSSALMDENFVKPIGIKSIEAIRSGELSDQFLDDSTALYTFTERYKRKASVKHEVSLSAVELSGRVVIQGYLLKQGHNRKSWKVRLFILRAEPGYLHYYDPSRDDHRPVGGFPLRGCLVSALEDNGVHSGVKGKLQGNLFKIITQNDIHYYIQATSKEERLEWISALKQLTC
ncbi:pleckstrin-2-like [Acipenser ruthenus]|uniref:pleckstrin-2-like n=1 Tax=Acipenser ruthenus TaxID=7906 RepID=UPI00145B0EED|nr:pleckstrin-2-like [Acipenser ruthenus]